MEMRRFLDEDIPGARAQREEIIVTRDDAGCDDAIHDSLQGFRADLQLASELRQAHRPSGRSQREHHLELLEAIELGFEECV